MQALGYFDEQGLRKKIKRLFKRMVLRDYTVGSKGFKPVHWVT